ncbi:hypothetical protein T440DRAFT_475225 [Plenodomus tracheiphilus IPT5]|uniref:Uncharacterized protein n=1 Tax=Plenodomus tracheiphilus IPT5 TaxID=1408161 RepID=A0A6A7BL30_9PLEO|nr:hypothetical protein T440DRAFT_475225 [Plenodomus tracheiphilus IPT5]
MSPHLPLSNLYNNIFPAIGNRIWNQNLIEEAHALSKLAAIFNQRALLRTALTADPETLSKRPGIKCLRDEMAGDEMRERIAVCNEVLARSGVESWYIAPDVWGKRYVRDIDTLVFVSEEDERGEGGDTGITTLALVLSSYKSLAWGVCPPPPPPCLHVTSSGEETKIDNHFVGEKLLWTLHTRPLHRHFQNCECHHDTPPYAPWKARWNSHSSTPAPEIDDRAWVKLTTLPTGKKIYGFKSITQLSPQEANENSRLLVHWQKTRQRLLELLHFNAKRLAVVARSADDPLVVEVVAQDPLYCVTCQGVLKEELCISAVSDCSAFLKVERESFVVCIAAGAPVGQIIADLTMRDEEGGGGGPKESQNTNDD